MHTPLLFKVVFPTFSAMLDPHTPSTGFGWVETCHGRADKVWLTFCRQRGK